MVTINLLPWRSEQKKKELRALTTEAIICAVSVFCLILVIHFSLALKTEAQIKRNNQLQSEITSINSMVSKLKTASENRKTYIKKINTLQTLQNNRFSTVDLFDQFIRLIPKGIYLDQLERVEGSILISGQSNANALISKLIKNIDASEDFTRPLLKEVQTQKIDDISTTTFTLSFNLKSSDNQDDISALTGSKKK